METGENRKRRRESPSPVRQTSTKDGDADKSNVRCGAFMTKDPRTDRNKGTVPPPKKTRTEEGSSRSPRTLGNAENGIRQQQAGAGNPLDPRLNRRRASMAQISSAPGSPLAKTTEDYLSRHDYQRSMQNLNRLESQRVAKQHLYRSVQKKLKEKQDAFEKNLVHLNTYPEMKKKREQDIQSIQDEMNELKRACQKIDSELDSEKEKFNKAVARLEEHARATESGHHEERSPAKEEELKALKERIKTLEESLQGQTSRSDTLSNRVTTLDNNLATQQDTLSDSISAKVMEVFETINGYMESSDARITSIEKQVRSAVEGMAEGEDKLKKLNSKVDESIEERQGKDEAFDEYFVRKLNEAKTETKATLDKSWQAITQTCGELSNSFETLQTSVENNADTAAVKATLGDLSTRVVTLESRPINPEPTSGPSNRDLDRAIKETKQSLSAVQNSQDHLNTRVRKIETELDSRTSKAKDAISQTEKLAKRLDELAKSVTELQTAVDGDVNEQGLASFVSTLETKLIDTIEKFQELQSQLLDDDLGEVPSVQKKLKAVLSRLGKLEGGTAALKTGLTTSSSRATSMEVGSPRMSNGTAGGTLEQGNVNEKIAGAIKPLQDLVQAQQTELARFHNLDLDLNRILAGLGLEHVRHPDGSVTTQTNGTTSTNGIQYAHIPQNKVDELEQKIQVLQMGISDLARQHQNLTTAEMCNTIVKTVEKMYPQIFPATQKEIEKLANLIQLLNMRMNGTDTEVDKLNSVIEGVNGVAQQAAKNADKASERLDELDVANAATMGEIELVKARFDTQVGGVAGASDLADSTSASITQSVS